MSEPKYNRLFVKMVRDATRVHLKKADKCYISGETENLEVHHLYTLSALVTEFLEKNKITITDDNKLEVRRQFIDANKDKVQEQYVLTKQLHKKLHVIFGISYPNHYVPKVKAWMEKQKERCQ